MNINQLFPLPIAFFDLGRPLESNELNFIMDQPQRKNLGNTSSQDNYLTNKPELQDLHNFFTESANEFLKEVYQPSYNTQLRITQSWANYTNNGQFHHKHAHPNSVVSGVFYVKTTQGKDRIYFYRSGFQQIKFKTENWNQFNSESWWFDAVEGQLIMFPSHLEHMVQTLDHEDTRVSLSFNTFPTGIIGDEMELTELIL